MNLATREYCVTPGEITQFGVPKTMQMKPMFEFARKLLNGFVDGIFEWKFYSRSNQNYIGPNPLPFGKYNVLVVSRK
jgi:ABC-type proline/glycine betaine transport system ATPase subunit